MKAVKLLGKPVDKIKVLDIGCGGGRTTVPLHNMGFDVVGIDISENLIKILKKRFPKVKAQVADAMKLPFKSNSFDIAIFSHNSLDCLYPYEKRDKCLKEINRVLKNNGFFLYSTHVFNFIPFNPLILRNIITNLPSATNLLTKGHFYYKERMGNGSDVLLYASTLAYQKKELAAHGFKPLVNSRIVYIKDSDTKTYLHTVLNWERYHLAQKYEKKLK
jgi:ubiquinone/menaquinone biosynthesis C-methylase UbiE